MDACSQNIPPVMLENTIRVSLRGLEDPDKRRVTKIEMARITDEEIRTKPFEVLNYAGSLLERGSG